MQSILMAIVLISTILTPLSSALANSAIGKNLNPCASIPNSKPTFDPITKELVGCVLTKVDPKSELGKSGKKPGDVIKIK